MNGAPGRIKGARQKHEGQSQEGAPLVAQTASDPDPIRAGLKKIYDAVVEEAIPDEFMALLDRIDAARAPPAAAGKAAE